MKKRFYEVIILIFSVILIFGCSTTEKRKTQKSLYSRIGGYDAVAAVVDDFLGRMASDQQLKRFFEGAEQDHLKRTRQLIVEFVCAATGGPCYYTGRDMKVTHKGLGITERDWNLAVKHFVATLNHFKVPDKEKNELVTLVGSLKGSVVDSMIN